MHIHLSGYVKNTSKTNQSQAFYRPFGHIRPSTSLDLSTLKTTKYGELGGGLHSMKPAQGCAKGRNELEESDRRMDLKA